MKCPNCGRESDGGTCPYCGQKPEEGNAPENRESAPVNPADRYSMKWHRFLMVIMIISGIVVILNGLMTFTGFEYMQEGYDASEVYTRFPGLKGWDMFYGAALLFLGVFTFYVRNQLNQFRARGPKLLIILYFTSLVSALVYMIAVSSLLQVSPIMFETVAPLCVSAAFLVINSVYYAKRRELFVN